MNCHFCHRPALSEDQLCLTHMIEKQWRVDFINIFLTDDAIAEMYSKPDDKAFLTAAEINAMNILGMTIE